MTDDVIQAIAAEIRKRDTTKLEYALDHLAVITEIYGRCLATLIAIDNRSQAVRETNEGADQVYWQIDTERIEEEKAKYLDLIETVTQNISDTIESMSA